MSARIEDLEPETQAMCREFLAACERRGFKVRVTHTLRTYDEQAHLYAKGRTLPGTIVTKAPPGYSWHNFGRAFDICFQGGQPYPDDQDLWHEVGLIGEGVGLHWGGRFQSLRDLPHFENAGSLSLADARNLRDQAMKGEASA